MLLLSASAQSFGVTEDSPLYVEVLLWAVFVISVLLSGFFSGINLALLMIEPMQLDILMTTGTQEERIQARAIKPVRKLGNLLICVILLGNVAVNALISILLASLTNPLLSLLISTIVITVAAEILPQAIFARHALYYSYHTLWVTKLWIVILFVVCAPIAWLLDLCLGQEMGRLYTKEQLKHLIKIHATSKLTDLNHEEANIILGALSISQSTAAEHMTGANRIFSLDIDDKITPTIVQEIQNRGFSRIPICTYKCVNGKKCKQMKSMLLLKDLVLIALQPSEIAQNITSRLHSGTLDASTLMEYVSPRPVLQIDGNMTLDRAYLLFRNTRTHIAVVHDADEHIIGLLSMEDVIEEIVAAEIVDETDPMQRSMSSQKRLHASLEGKELPRVSTPTFQEPCRVVTINGENIELD